ncbi:MAG TPA: hypothetical protein VGJ57_07385 [Nitrospirales bacterium]
MRWLIALLLLFSATAVQAELLRPVSQIRSGQAEARGLPSFPESPLLEYGERLEGWVADSITATGRWRGDVETKLWQFLRSHGLGAHSPCNVFLANALKLLFGIADFETPNLPGAFLQANDIARYVSKHPEQWTLLGPASNQVALERAQAYANLNTPVIAVYESAPHGHVAVILPGNLRYSLQWNLQAPNSASVFLDRPYKSYVGLMLSNAFQASHLPSVMLYSRTSSN